MEQYFIGLQETFVDLSNDQQSDHLEPAKHVLSMFWGHYGKPSNRKFEGLFKWYTKEGHFGKVHTAFLEETPVMGLRFKTPR